jgi:hypothetical protein
LCLDSSSAALSVLFDVPSIAKVFHFKIKLILTYMILLSNSFENTSVAPSATLEFSLTEKVISDIET